MNRSVVPAMKKLCLSGRIATTPVSGTAVGGGSFFDAQPIARASSSTIGSLRAGRGGRIIAAQHFSQRRDRLFMWRILRQAMQFLRIVLLVVKLSACVATIAPFGVAPAVGA